MISRREFLKLSAVTGGGAFLARNLKVLESFTPASLLPGLSDPAIQPKFEYYAPNALAPGFIYQPRPDGTYNVAIKETKQMTGLVHPNSGKPLSTTIWGYGYDDEKGVSWPGRTFQIRRGENNGITTVRWDNLLFGKKHLVPVDTSLHWAFSLPGYEQYSIQKNGVPIITHLHGGHSDFQFDGNPEFFYTPDAGVVGPQWFRNGLNGFIKDFTYDNDVPAGTLWYHDHALGITRLNVYAGLAGFYIMRDDQDTGEPGNPLGLPAYPYELAYAIQDRMFTDKGELFYPAFPGDPAWADFITGQGLSDDQVPQPSVLAEFFGDHMLVNGIIWPKEDVEPRHYRMRLLNGTDSRFMVVRFRSVDLGATDPNHASASDPLDFDVIGSDQGLAGAARTTNTLLFEPGSRYDIVFNFSDLAGKRVIMENLGGDAPFGGFGSEEYVYEFTNRVMAFDVVLDKSDVPDNYDAGLISAYGGNNNEVNFTRKVALFEGMDEYGRLQPLLGTAEDAVDMAGNTVNGTIPWHAPTTENPALHSTEIWEIYNATEDAHPIHLHLVNFQVLDRYEFDATVVQQPVMQHNGTTGMGARLENITLDGMVNVGSAYFEDAPKDMVIALPEQMTRIKATFDKPGRYVWHCHILSHEDHEMMRVLYVG